MGSNKHEGWEERAFRQGFLTALLIQFWLWEQFHVLGNAWTAVISAKQENCLLSYFANRKLLVIINISPITLLNNSTWERGEDARDLVVVG